MTLDEARAFARAHADVCLDKSCHALANALEGAEIAEARRLLHDTIDPVHWTTVGIPLWSAVSRLPSVFHGGQNPQEN